MVSEYYLANITDLEIGDGEMEAIEILKAFFDEGVWLFPERAPDVEALKSGDNILVCGPYKGHNCVLGRFTLKSKPQEQRDHFSNIPLQLSDKFSLGAEIMEALVWGNPYPLGLAVPEPGVFEEKEYNTFPLSPGLQQLSRDDFERIVLAGETSKENIEVSYDQLYPFSDNLPQSEDISTELNEHGYMNALQTAKWFQELVSSELIKRREALGGIVEQLGQIPLLKEKMEALQDITETQRLTVVTLQEEKQAQGERLQQIKEKLDRQELKFTEAETVHNAEIMRFNSERQELLSEIEMLKDRLADKQKELEEISTVKKALRSIVGLLRGKGRDYRESQ